MDFISNLAPLLDALRVSGIPCMICTFVDGGDVHFRVRITNREGGLAEGILGDIATAEAWLYTEAKKAWPDFDMENPKHFILQPPAFDPTSVTYNDPLPGQPGA